MGWPDVFAQCCTNGSGGTTLVDSGVSVYFVQLCVVGVGSSGSMFYLIKSGEVDVLPYQVDAVTDADTVVSATPRTRLHVGQHFGEVSERERPGGLGEPSSIFLVETLFVCVLCVCHLNSVSLSRTANGSTRSWQWTVSSVCAFIKSSFPY